MKIQIPRYNQGPVQNSRFSPVNVNIPASSGYKGLDDMANILHNISKDIDNTKNNEAQSKYLQDYSDFVTNQKETHKGLDANNETLQKEREAWQNEWMQKNVLNSESNLYLSNDAKKSFDRFILNHNVSAVNTENIYSMQELEKAKDLGFKANISALSEAIASENNIDNIILNEMNIDNAVYTQYKGYPKEYIESLSQEYKSKARASNVENNILTNASLAASSYIKLSPGIKTNDKMNLAVKIRDAYIDQTSNRLAEERLAGVNSKFSIDQNVVSIFGKGSEDSIGLEINLKSSELFKQKREELIKAKQMNQSYDFGTLVDINGETNSSAFLSGFINDLTKNDNLAKNYNGIELGFFKKTSEGLKNENVIIENKTINPDAYNRMIVQWNRDEAEYGSLIREGLQNGTIRTINDMILNGLGNCSPTVAVGLLKEFASVSSLNEAEINIGGGLKKELKNALSAASGGKIKENDYYINQLSYLTYQTMQKNNNMGMPKAAQLVYEKNKNKIKDNEYLNEAKSYSYYERNTPLQERQSGLLRAIKNRDVLSGVLNVSNILLDKNIYSNVDKNMVDL